MLKPSYAELMDALNKDSENDVTSRYTVVIAASKRARQIIDGDEPMVEVENEEKPVSIAIEEIKEGKIKVVPEGEGTVIEPKINIKDAIKEELNTAAIDFNSDDDDDTEAEGAEAEGEEAEGAEAEDTEDIEIAEEDNSEEPAPDTQISEEANEAE